MFMYQIIYLQWGHLNHKPLIFICTFFSDYRMRAHTCVKSIQCFYTYKIGYMRNTIHHKKSLYSSVIPKKCTQKYQVFTVRVSSYCRIVGTKLLFIFNFFLNLRGQSSLYVYSIQTKIYRAQMSLYKIWLRRKIVPHILKKKIKIIYIDWNKPYSLKCTTKRTSFHPEL